MAPANLTRGQTRSTGTRSFKKRMLIRKTSKQRKTATKEGQAANRITLDDGSEPLIFTY